MSPLGLCLIVVVCLCGAGDQEPRVSDTLGKHIANEEWLSFRKLYQLIMSGSGGKSRKPL